MAISTGTVWEVRTTGSDSNAGGYVPGAGTDYSQRDTPIVTGTVTSATTTVTATSPIFTAAMVNNLITDGTTWKQITVFTSSTVVTVDSAPSWTAASISVGGALATLGKLASLMVVRNRAFLKASAGYSTGVTLTFAQASSGVTNSQTANRLTGYTTTRGDNGRATITATATGITVLSFTNGGWYLENLVIDGASNATTTGVAFAAAACTVRNCLIKGCGTASLTGNTNGNLSLIDSEFTTCAGTSSVNAGIGGANVTRCYVHGNTGIGILVGSASVVDHCLIVNNTGASSDGIQCSSGARIMFTHNTIYGNGRHGIFNNNTTFGEVNIRNNILASNGASGTGYGLVANSTVGIGADPLFDGNAYWNNATGTRQFADDTTSTPINAAAPYTNVLDVILTGNPFNNSSGGDFSLNDVFGAGRSCRAVGSPGPIPGVSQLGYIDMGCFQHQGSSPVINQIINRYIMNEGDL